MKKALIRFVATYLLFVIIFVLQKPIFMFCYHKIFKQAVFSDYIDVIWNGLPLDFASAGYLTIIPGLLIIASVWVKSSIMRPLFNVYFGLVSITLSLIFVTDIILYEYWGFRLDSTPFFYFFSSPKDALASSGYLLAVVSVLIILALAWIINLPFGSLNVDKKEVIARKDRGKVSAVIGVLVLLLIIPIRGGFTVSTMNLSKAYYSSNMYYNHATINPFFSLMESMMREKKFEKQYRFMKAQEADDIFERLMIDRPPGLDSIPRLLNVERPNVVFIVLESFMSKFMESLGGIPNVAVNMDKFAEEGVLFTNFYANSFRTDRGLVSLFSGYPAQPTTSIMKYPRKTQSLPSIPLSLSKAGYNSQYYYGGDADFTNMRSYLLSMGIEKIVSDVDFPIGERLSKWGAHDHVLFNRVIKDFKEEQKEPFLKIIQTSSSHEPFQVPYDKLKDPFENSVAYADSCLGQFIKRFRNTKYWDNTLIVLVADHGRRASSESFDSELERFQIPFVLFGGAVEESKRVDTYASQIDIAATLLDQLNLPHDEFTFSKNILNPSSPHFAYFAYPNSFGIVTANSRIIFDCDLNKTVLAEGANLEESVQRGKAFLQKLYDDLATR